MNYEGVNSQSQHHSTRLENHKSYIAVHVLHIRSDWHAKLHNYL